ncbi:synaptonemal complex central element protein 3 [Gouania willdenowi]|uniref:synaptonemal complex central element protein 3 n=1 Tax=Gouania willdenowi TaxID=441366 RepID=UPI0010567990|nr:synaptonemal complex central element protein 3 [Gouania willdenowi]
MSELPVENPQETNEDSVELNKELERMTEDVENISVQLSWMAYDMVTLRTDPQLVASLQKLEETFQRCRAAVAGNSHLEPHEDERLDTASNKLSQM